MAGRALTSLQRPWERRALADIKEAHLPFVTIRMVEGAGDDAKSRIAETVAQAISKETGVAVKSVWVVFEDVRPQEWFVGASSVAQLRRDAPA